MTDFRMKQCEYRCHLTGRACRAYSKHKVKLYIVDDLGRKIVMHRTARTCDEHSSLSEIQKKLGLNDMYNWYKEGECIVKAHHNEVRKKKRARRRNLFPIHPLFLYQIFSDTPSLIKWPGIFCMFVVLFTKSMWGFPILPMIPIMICVFIAYLFCMMRIVPPPGPVE